jgi:hypothetical protein
MTSPTIPATPPSAAATRATTSRHYVTTVSVNGVSLGEFEAMSGGSVAAESPKHTVGGSRRVAMGGPRETDDVTVSRSFYYDRDHDLARQLLALAGEAEVVINRAPLDRDGRPFGRPLVYTGVLSTVTYPEQDAESSDLSRLELTVTVDGDVA